MLLALLATLAVAGTNLGYYRSPTLAGDTVVFTAEGDLWKVGIGPGAAGVATRLTSHPEEETSAALSPDGKTVAFVASYEGPQAVYSMPVDGGLPTRWTWSGTRLAVVGWTPAGEILYTSDAASTLPSIQLFRLDPRTGHTLAVPLAEASDGAYAGDGKTLYFTRMPFQGSHTKGYQGGTAQQLWRYTEGDPEATLLTGDWAGTSRRAMWWDGRVYFVSDRDGTMNLWSMDAAGHDLRQLTHHAGWDVQTPSLAGGRIVYKLGADLRVVDVATGADRALAITLDSDFDQTRERWVTAPMDYLSSWHLSPSGDRVALTARGQVWVAPVKDGRLAEVTHEDGARWRDARFTPDGARVVALSDGSGEVEVWDAPANGDGAPTQLTHDGVVLRWSAVPSPDGRWVASANKNQELWLHDRTTGETRRIDVSAIDMITDLAWSPDGRWLVYVKRADNQYQRLTLYDTTSGTLTPLTTDRFDSYAPAWSPDGKWLYFLSERSLVSVVPSVWGPLQPEPFFDRRTKVYQLALQADGRSPFAPADELHPPPPPDEAGKNGENGKEKGKKAKKEAEKLTPVVIDLAGLADRLWEVPLPPANRTGLLVGADALFWLESDAGPDAKLRLQSFPISNDRPEVKQLVDDVKSAELSADRKKLLVRKGDTLHVFDASTTPPDLAKTAVDLGGWTFPVAPRDEWRQMFVEAWRLERDYFWDTGMSGVDWPAVKAKYLPLVDRVRSRADLSDVLAQMVSELGVLHSYVYGGDFREGPPDVPFATLGAEMVVDPKGWKVARIYRSDPDDPNRRSPLQRPGVEVPEGSFVTRINGVPTASVADPAVLLRATANRQVLLHVLRPDGAEADVIVRPLDAGADADLRYLDWEYSRRQIVEAAGEGRIGYLHLRAMGGGDFSDFARGFYPVFTREGLIVDVRHNRGGNIDSWVIEKLARKAWSFWSQRVGNAPSWNMQYAFRGHIVVLCDQRTASDGEAFAEGMRRLGLARVIGARTWGGEIWLSSDNVLVDKGIATAAEYGLYGPEGAWLIEGHGVEPDEAVDNLPVATFAGGDAQLDAAIRYLKARIAADPVPGNTPPAKPDRAR